MNYSIFRFTLNMHNHRSQVSVPAFMGDTGIRLLISLTDGGNPYFIKGGCIAVLGGTKPNGDKLYNRCLLENPIEKDGEIHYTRIVYDFTEQTANCNGVTNCEVILYGTDGDIITAPKFVIVVDEREVGYDDIIESETEKNALDLAMSAAAGEEARVTAEAERVSAEEARVLAEAERVKNEEGREKPLKLYRHDITISASYYEETPEGVIGPDDPQTFATGCVYRTTATPLTINDISASEMMLIRPHSFLFSDSMTAQRLALSILHSNGSLDVTYLEYLYNEYGDAGSVNIPSVNSALITKYNFTDTVTEV